MKNSRLRLHNLMMYYDVSLVRHQHLSYVAHKHLVNLVTLGKRHRLVAKEDHPFRERL